MAKRNQVSIDITANDKATTPLQKVTSKLNETTAAVRSATDPIKKLQNSFTNFSLAVPGIKLLGESFGKLKGAVTECVSAFAELEKSTRQLNFAQNINLQLKAVGADLTKFANDASKSIGNIFSAGEIQDAISGLAFDHTIEQIESITTVAMDLSAATGKDLKSSVDILADTLNGKLNTELKRIFPELATFDAEALKSGEAIAALGEKLNGLASDMSGTTSSSVTAFNNTLGDLKETLGDMFSTSMTPMRNYFTELLGNLNSAIVEFMALKRAKKAVEEGTATSEEAIKRRNYNVGILSGSAAGAPGWFTDEIAEAFSLAEQNGVQRIYDAWGIGQDKIDKAYSKFLRNLNGVGDLADVFEKEVDEYQKSLELIKTAMEEEAKEREEAGRKAKELAAALEAASVSTTTNVPTTAAKEPTTIPETSIDWSLINKNAGNVDLGLNQLTGNYDKSMDRELSTENQLSIFGGSFVEVAAGMSEFLGPLLAMTETLNTVSQILTPLVTILKEMFSTLDPIVNSILQPLLNILRIIGQSLAQAVLPVFNALVPVIQLVIEVFTWLYNKVLRPIGNALIGLFNMFYDAVVGVCNGMIYIYNLLVSKKHERAYMSYVPLKTGQLQEISETYAKDFGSVTTDNSTVGGAASYNAARDIIVNITYTNSYVNGDAREIALNIRNEIRSAEALGY